MKRLLFLALPLPGTGTIPFSGCTSSGPGDHWPKPDESQIAFREGHR